MHQRQQRQIRQKRWQQRALALALSWMCAGAYAAPGWAPENLRLMALAPADGRAVLQTPDHALHTVGVGETLPGTAAVVRKVLPAMLVLEVPGERDAGPQQIWMFRYAGAQTPPMRHFSRSAPPVLVQAPPRVMRVPALQSAIQAGNP